ncbi:MAG: precorrin-6y C5,15-methyltransferase (decarboxylating) subunit CbiE [Alphaproteobacteria bacterium]|nr:precorrin-6y C5,15-methyltransferase (decarboxylating) subunit CbiE [Alphaproteobacteria bacterium]
MSAWLKIVGIGAGGLDDLSGPARTLIASAELLVGGERHLAMVANDDARKLAWKFPLDGIVREINAARDQRVVVLATGDPMSFGIGSTLARHFAPTDMAIVPAPGAFSLAAARMAWPLHGCTCLTLHGRPLELLNHHLLPNRRLLILSHDGTTPGQVATTLCHAGFGPSQLTVFENMGAENAAVRTCRADAWDATNIENLNTIAVECKAGPDARYYSPATGLPDDAFLHDGQLTKRIVRAATIAALAPLPGQHLWDLGAGCGSVAIEWLRTVQDVQGQGARASAVEHTPSRSAIMAQNACRLGAPFLNIVTAEIESALPELDDPDAVFLGGGISGSGLIKTVWERLGTGGRLVANVVTLEGERAVLNAHAKLGGDLVRIAISHADPVGGLTGWRPAMPVTQWSVVKP